MSQLNSFSIRRGATAHRPTRTPRQFNPPVLGKVKVPPQHFKSKIYFEDIEDSDSELRQCSLTSVQSPSVRTQYDIGCTRKVEHEDKFDSLTDTDASLTCLGQNCLITTSLSLSSTHNDLLRTDSGNSSLSTTDSLSNASTESHNSNFHSTLLNHIFNEDFSPFEKDDFIRVNIYVPESQSEVINVKNICKIC